MLRKTQLTYYAFTVQKMIQFSSDFAFYFVTVGSASRTARLHILTPRHCRHRPEVPATPSASPSLASEWAGFQPAPSGLAIVAGPRGRRRCRPWPSAGRACPSPQSDLASAQQCCPHSERGRCAVRGVCYTVHWCSYYGMPLFMGMMIMQVTSLSIIVTLT